VGLDQVAAAQKAEEVLERRSLAAARVFRPARRGFVEVAPDQDRDGFFSRGSQVPRPASEAGWVLLEKPCALDLLVATVRAQLAPAGSPR
jgi:hypothetical protein